MGTHINEHKYFTLRGSFDIDDLILNMLGSLIGYMINYFTKLSAYFSD